MSLWPAAAQTLNIHSKTRQEMSLWASDKVPVAFWDVAACFAEEDWKLLHEGQKVFYRNVMKEIHQTLITLGYKILNTGTLLRVIKWEDTKREDADNVKRQKDRASSHHADASLNPDIFLRIKHVEEQICRDLHSSEETEIVNSLGSGNQNPNPEMLLRVIKWEDENNEDPEHLNRATNHNDPTSSYPFDPSDFVLRIKEEDELWPVDTLDCEKRLDMNSDPDNAAVTKTENLPGNPRRWDINRKEIIPTEDGHTHSAVLISRPSQKNNMSHMCTKQEDPSNIAKDQSYDVRPEKCRYCSKVFIQRSRLMTHMRRIHTEEKSLVLGHLPAKDCQVVDTVEKPYMCEVCKKNFSKPYALKVHQRIHAGEKPFECPECKKAFNHSSALKVHLRRHTGEKPYWCTECTKGFPSIPDLRRHKRTHTGEKPYECTKCKKSYSHQSALKRHQRIHTGEKPYECTKCKKTFRYDTALKAHQTVHTGEKPFVCKVCTRAFSHFSNLIKHKKIHTGEKPYRCTECGKNYNQASHLRRHHCSQTGANRPPVQSVRKGSLGDKFCLDSTGTTYEKDSISAQNAGSTSIAPLL